METTESIKIGDFTASAVSACALTTGVLAESYRIMSQQHPSTLFTRLGGLFFRTLIRRAVNDGRADLVVAKRNSVGRVDGFAVLVHTKSWLSETVRQYPAAFAMASVAALARPTAWPGLLSRIQYRLSQRSVGQDGRPAPSPPDLPGIELYMLAVRPGSEGQGCGRALIRGVEQRVRGAGGARYKVFTPVANRRANRFYRRNGLTRIGHVEPIDMDMNVYVKDL